MKRITCIYMPNVRTFLPVVFALLTVSIGSTARLAAQSSTTAGSSASAPAPAKTFHPTSDQIIRQSEIIAVGKVASIHSEWDAGHTRISTRVSLTVDEYLKGSQSENTLTITHAGGEVGTEGELYSETATFKKDEEVMVFVRKDPQGTYRVTGAEKGKISITTDKATGMNTIGGAMSLDELKSKIKTVVKTQQQR